MRIAEEALSQMDMAESAHIDHAHDADLRVLDAAVEVASEALQRALVIPRPVPLLGPPTRCVHSLPLWTLTEPTVAYRGTAGVCQKALMYKEARVTHRVPRVAGAVSVCH